MKHLSMVRIVCAGIIGAWGMSYGENDVVTLSPSGFAALREGQVVKGEPDHTYQEAKSDHVWVQEMDVGLNVKAMFNNLPVTGNLGLEMKVVNDNMAFSGDLGTSRRLNFYPYLSRADLAYTWGDRENPSFVLDAGYFPFKYDNDARNLGEYLFRSGTYPQYLITNFDFPLARLMGLHASGSAFGCLKWDVLATTNIEWTAIGDLNLSALLAYKPASFVELGIGGSWCSILSVNMDNTTPESSAGSEYIYDGKRYWYTFAGRKVMGRLSFDIRKLIPIDIFGQQDLKLYSEAAILGMDNYPMSIDSVTQYDTLMQRIPVMVGFNWPTYPLFSYTLLPLAAVMGLDKTDFENHPITVGGGAVGVGIVAGIGTWLLEKYFQKNLHLDVLSVEVEWFGNPYPNSMKSVVFDNQPVPLSSYGNERNAINLNNHGDDWKWSVYGKKTFAGHFNVTFQFARDHMRWDRLDYTKIDWMEALRKNNDWYYTFKFGYLF